MNRSRLLLALSFPAALALLGVACEDSSGSPGTLGGVDGSVIGFDASTTDARQDLPADGRAPDAGDSGRACSFSFWDGGVLLNPTPYRQLSDSPFSCLQFAAYFHVATFEGDGGLPPGTSGPGTKYPGTDQTSSITDSVDGDDGFPDGAPPDSGSTHPCPGCQSWFGGPMDFVFDEATLGALPTHAGMVWTDDGNDSTVTFSAYGADGGLIATQAVPGIGNGGITGATDEDRFFGVVWPGGVKRITMSHTGGGIEIDHLQLGR
jgi:hypothetical protein